MLRKASIRHSSLFEACIEFDRIAAYRSHRCITSEASHYDVLGVDQTSTPAQIKAAFYAKAKQLHPDSATSALPPKEGITHPWIRLLQAYQCLSNPRSKQLYDLSRSQTAPPFLRNAASSGLGPHGPYHPGQEATVDITWGGLDSILGTFGARATGDVDLSGGPLDHVRAELRDEFHAALRKACFGPAPSGLAAGCLPDEFEGDERATLETADVLALVSGRHVLGVVRERRVEQLAKDGDAATDLISSSSAAVAATATAATNAACLPFETHGNTMAETHDTRAVHQGGAMSAGATRYHYSTRNATATSYDAKSAACDEQEGVPATLKHRRASDSGGGGQHKATSPPRCEAETETAAAAAEAGEPQRHPHQSIDMSSETQILDLVMHGKKESIATAVRCLSSQGRKTAIYRGDELLATLVDAAADDADESNNASRLAAASTEDAAACGSRNESTVNAAFTIKSGVNDLARTIKILDAQGRHTHTAMRSFTPLVRHLTFVHEHGQREAHKKTVVARAHRAWLPPSNMWLFAPRSYEHDIGGWTISWAGHALEHHSAWLHPAIITLMAALDTMEHEAAARQPRGLFKRVQCGGGDGEGGHGIVGWLKAMMRFHRGTK